MLYNPGNQRKAQRLCTMIGTFAMAVSLLPAQDRPRDRDRDRDGDRDRDRDFATVLEPGTVIPVRTNEPIDVERRDNRVYHGIVDQDVRGGNGRLAIPRGS